MTEFTSIQNPRLALVLLRIVVVVKGIAMLSPLPSLLSMGAAFTALTFLLPMIYVASEIVLSLMAMSAVKSGRRSAFVLTASVAVLQMPTFLFPVALGLFWSMLPKEISDKLLAVFREEFGVDRGK